MADEPVRCTVCHALPDRVWQVQAELPAGADVAQALRTSGFAQAFPGLDPWACGVGIYGKPCQPDTPVREHDRIEIYRPLDFDPMESRRRRAAHRPLPFGKRRH
ncbi:RnfH family protein [Orrella sp. JC864]|uniref:RnfH family protein n=1 Tax=Orrella sp. JC864 TaxID=3120298 RepID=UPI0012BC6828